MKKPPPVALLCAGNLADSGITRFRGLAARLGPVKSSSLRLASRFANTLRAGYPVVDYLRFQDCSLVLLAVPEAMTARAVYDLSRAELDWTHGSVVLCSPVLESEELSPLAKLGARTASICETAGSDGRSFVVEGDREAIRQVRPLVEGGTRTRASRILSLPPGHKKFYLAGLACTGPIFSSLLNCAGECLKLAGITAADANELLQTTAERTTRSHLKGGRKNGLEPVDFDHHVAALRSKNPEIAEFFQQSAKLVRWISK